MTTQDFTLTLEQYEQIAPSCNFRFNAAHFALDSGVFTIHPTFALVPEFVGGMGEFEYSFEGKTLELVWRKIELADAIPDPNTAVGVRYVSRWQRLMQQ